MEACKKVRNTEVETPASVGEHHPLPSGSAPPQGKSLVDFQHERSSCGQERMRHQSLTPELCQYLSRMSAIELLSVLGGKPFEAHRNPDDLLRVKEAAAFLNVSVSYLRRRAKDGTGPKRTELSNQVVRYRVSDLIEWRDKRGQGNG